MGDDPARQAAQAPAGYPPVATAAAPPMPDRPQLASATWLVGYLHESALERPPWAIERAGHGSILMGELAFRIAEQATGEQTVAEIAREVSAALERPVRPADVQALLDTVLIPRGVVSDPAGREASDGDPPIEDAPVLEAEPEDAVPGAGEAAQVHLPAAPAARRRGYRRRFAPAQRGPQERTIGPGPIEAAASVLMWLFWPPVMVVVLAAGLGMLLWLYLIHGLAPSMVQVLTFPVLLLPLVLVTEAVLVLQPLGPMVALYGSGGKIDRLRIVPSLPHPRLEADVSDDYGLARWTRLTVNLSGVYVQLVLVLVLGVVAAVSGAEFLYLAITLVALNVLRLLLPFGRRDADRLLTDLLLVPQPLRYAKQALGRWLPGHRPTPEPLPPLKRWGRIVLGVYLGLAVSALLVLGLVVLWSVPVVIATVLAALLAHLAAMPEAVGDRDLVGIVGSLIQAAILTSAAFSFVVWCITRAWGMLLAAWTWSRLTRQRRLVGGVATLVAILGLILVWVPTPASSAYDATEDASPRSLAGVAFQPLTPLSRGRLFDLFGDSATGPVQER